MGWRAIRNGGNLRSAGRATLAEIGRDASAVVARNSTLGQRATGVFNLLSPVTTRDLAAAGAGILTAVGIHASDNNSDGGVPLDDIPSGEVTRRPGSRQLGDLEPIHSGDLNPGADGIRGLSDDELMGSITDPENGDPVVVGGDGNRVLDGNTRVEEAGRRFPPDTEIPVEEQHNGPG